MVFFSCEGCNESLKKNQVDSHAARCKSCWAVSCVDCSVVFPGDDYRAHTSCVSEAERYEKTVYRGVKKADIGKVSGKKLGPQEVWNNVLLEAEGRKDEADSSIRGHLKTLSNCDNVPRKEKQFRNFANNSLKLRGTDPALTKIWEFLDSIRNEKKVEKEGVEEKKKVCKEEEVLKEEKKRKHSDVDDELTVTTTTSATATDLTKPIKKLLKKADNKSMKVSELLTSLSSEDSSLTKELLKTFVQSNKKFKIDGKVVSLV